VKLLDIGCSIGSTIRAGQLRGWESLGADVSQSAVDFCRRRSLEAYLMTDGALPFSDASFDIVTAWHVIEHVADVNAAVVEWTRVLRPGGILALETPNGSCWKARLLGKNLKNFWIPEHLYIFNPKNLQSILRRHQLELLPVPFVGRSAGGIGQRIHSTSNQLFKETMRRAGIHKAFQVMARKPVGQQNQQLPKAAA
jgi:ubiquinone/menaquinone biosynthesis C-methylase UbiE